MNLEKVVFGFFVLLAATLNFGFFIGDLGDPELHNAYELSPRSSSTSSRRCSSSATAPRSARCTSRRASSRTSS